MSVRPVLIILLLNSLISWNRPYVLSSVSTWNVKQNCIICIYFHKVKTNFQRKRRHQPISLSSSLVSPTKPSWKSLRHSEKEFCAVRSASDALITSSSFLRSSLMFLLVSTMCFSCLRSLSRNSGLSSMASLYSKWSSRTSWTMSSSSFHKQTRATHTYRHT